MATLDSTATGKLAIIDPEKRKADLSEAQKALRIAVDKIRQDGDEQLDEFSDSEENGQEDERSAQKPNRKTRRQEHVVSEAKAPKLRPASGTSIDL